ncbi:TlpA disulfide reductase family protein [Marivirga sp.]|uniref:TlpA family protein disulfide reductase n=1 Tax=Marivirga sp. TaxID=2018662 RepID=UPI0025D93BF8|nr:TlpA disulfide reductase family protein [Marivirga sp.]
MKYQYFFLAFTAFLLSNCTTKKDDNYSYKLESFATSMRDKYGVDFHKRVEFHELNSFSDSINGSYIGNYKFEDYYGNELELLTDSKPILLESFASWCAPCITSIPALNQLSKDYPDVRFIILAHDTPNKLEKYAKQINPNIHLVPSENQVNANQFIKLEVGEFQSVFPYPTTFTIDANGIIQNVLIGAPRAGNFGGMTISEKEVHEANILRLSRELDKLVSR